MLQTFRSNKTEEWFRRSCQTPSPLRERQQVGDQNPNSSQGKRKHMTDKTLLLYCRHSFVGTSVIPWKCPWSKLPRRKDPVVRVHFNVGSLQVRPVGTERCACEIDQRFHVVFKLPHSGVLQNINWTEDDETDALTSLWPVTHTLSLDLMLPLKY